MPIFKTFLYRKSSIYTIFIKLTAGNLETYNKFREIILYLNGSCNSEHAEYLPQVRRLFENEFKRIEL